MKLKKGLFSKRIFPIEIVISPQGYSLCSRRLGDESSYGIVKPVLGLAVRADIETHGTVRSCFSPKSVTPFSVQDPF
jgi:hypothetical protein